MRFNERGLCVCETDTMEITTTGKRHLLELLSLSLVLEVKHSVKRDVC